MACRRCPALLSLLRHWCFCSSWVGIGFAFGVVTVAFPDMKHILELTLQIVFYLTPIIYPPAVLAEQRFGYGSGEMNPFRTYWH